MKRVIRAIPNFPKEGILFRDITPLFNHQALCSKMTNAIIEQLPEIPNAVAGIESRGFLLGMMIANKLNVPFILMRKAGKLPGPVHRVDYALEYGKAGLEVQKDAIRPDWKVMIHDDLLATGGTAAAAAELTKKSNAYISCFSFLIQLNELKGTHLLNNYSNTIICLTQY